MNATLSIGVVGTLFGVVNAEVKVAAGANDYTNPHGSRIDTGTIFPLGSATKMFSATSVMRLAEQGKISLDETVQPYIDQYLSRTLPCGGLPADSYCLQTCVPQRAAVAECMGGGGKYTTNDCHDIGPRCLAECDGYFACPAVNLPVPTLQSIFEGETRMSQITFKHVIGLQSGVQDYGSWHLEATLASPPRDITPLEYLAHQKHPLLFDPGQGAAYSTNGFSLVGLALAGKWNLNHWYELDQHQLAWGDHAPPSDRTTFPTRGTCLQNGFHGDANTMVRQYYSASKASDKTFRDITGFSCLNNWMGGNVAAPPVDVARFVYQTYSPHSVLLSPSSQAMMQDYHLIDHGWGAHFIGYGLGTMVGPDLKPMKKCGLDAVGHEGLDYGSGAAFNYYVQELDLAITVAGAANIDGSSVVGMACDLKYSDLSKVKNFADSVPLAIVADALGHHTSCATEASLPSPTSNGWCTTENWPQTPPPPPPCAGASCSPPPPPPPPCSWLQHLRQQC